MVIDYSNDSCSYLTLAIATIKISSNFLYNSYNNNQWIHNICSLSNKLSHFLSIYKYDDMGMFILE